MGCSGDRRNDLLQQWLRRRTRGGVAARSRHPLSAGARRAGNAGRGSRGVRVHPSAASALHPRRPARRSDRRRAARPTRRPAHGVRRGLVGVPRPTAGPRGSDGTGARAGGAGAHRADPRLRPNRRSGRARVLLPAPGGGAGGRRGPCRGRGGGPLSRRGDGPARRSVAEPGRLLRLVALRPTAPGPAGEKGLRPQRADHPGGLPPRSRQGDRPAQQRADAQARTRVRRGARGSGVRPPGPPPR